MIHCSILHLFQPIGNAKPYSGPGCTEILSEFTKDVYKRQGDVCPWLRRCPADAVSLCHHHWLPGMGGPCLLYTSVCSPGGSTIQGVRVLEEHGLRGAVMDAVLAAYDKTKEMGKG